jgi:hypothetical protein
MNEIYLCSACSETIARTHQLQIAKQSLMSERMLFAAVRKFK